jgi:heme exporter protein D
MSEFFAMGGYAFYVWMSYGVTALVVVAEVLAVRARFRRALAEAQSSGPEVKVTSRSSLDPARSA